LLKLAKRAKPEGVAVSLLKVSFRTLQRYRVSGLLPFFTIGKKTYYRASDIRSFVRERADSQTYKQFEKAFGDTL